jgi:hypothetical protein
LRIAGRHGRPHAEDTGFVTRRGDDASLGTVADGDRTSAQTGIIALLDRRVEGVHVDMNDLSNRGPDHDPGGPLRPDQLAHRLFDRHEYAIWANRLDQTRAVGLHLRPFIR